MSRRTRTLAALIALGVSIVACSGGGDPAASPFCKEARAVGKLDQATQQLNDGDPARLKDAWAEYVSAAAKAGKLAPGSLKDDYAVYVTWLKAFRAALDRNEYRYAGALGDATFLKATETDEVAGARGAVDTYLADKCKVSAT